MRGIRNGRGLKGILCDVASPEVAKGEELRLRESLSAPSGSDAPGDLRRRG